jgi:SPOR domain
MWIWIYYGIVFLLGATLAFLTIRKMKGSHSLSLSDCFLRVSMFANLVTLAIAIMALQMGIASYIDRKKSGEDQIRQLQGLQGTLESLRLASHGSVSPAIHQVGDMQPKIVATAVPSAPQPPASSFGRDGSAQGEPSQSSFLPPGTTVLQVAAFVREVDALVLAERLQQRKFPAFVLTPNTDHFYRVQVGPYIDIRLAKIVRQQLKSQGFESIFKHRDP